MQLYYGLWPEVFANSCHYGQIVSCHGVSSEILSDSGKAFFSSLMREIVRLLGIHQTNTTAIYHLVWQSSSTAHSPLCWQRQPQLRKGVTTGISICHNYVLFVYRASEQQSTQESPFFLLLTLWTQS